MCNFCWVGWQSACPCMQRSESTAMRQENLIQRWNTAETFSLSATLLQLRLLKILSDTSEWVPVRSSISLPTYSTDDSLHVQQLYIIREPRATNVQPVGTCKLAYARCRLLYLVGYWRNNAQKPEIPSQPRTDCFCTQVLNLPSLWWGYWYNRVWLYWAKYSPFCRQRRKAG